jgi:hypothetical protein
MEDGSLHGRQQTRSLALEKDHLACSYTLGDYVEIETHLWWNGPWQFHLHLYQCKKPARLLLGGQSLSSKKSSDLKESQLFPTISWKNTTHHAVLRSLHGFDSANSRHVTAPKQPRTQIYGSNSLTPYIQTKLTTGDGCLVALHAVAPITSPLDSWELSESKAGHWTLKNKSSQTWNLRHTSLPSI